MQSRSTIFFFFYIRYIDVNEYRFLEQLAFTDIADSIPGLDSVQFPESSVHFERQRDLELRFGYIISRISNVFVRIKKTKKKKRKKKGKKRKKNCMEQRERYDREKLYSIKVYSRKYDYNTYSRVLDLFSDFLLRINSLNL